MGDQVKTEQTVEAVSIDEHWEQDADVVTGGDIKYNDIPWYKVPHLRYLNFCIFLISLTSTNNGYDGSMLNGLQSLSFWRDSMGQPTGYILGALSNGTIFGSLLTIWFGPYISDRFGRRFGIVVGQTLTVVGAILQGASTNYAFFLISRMIIGFGSCTATISSPSLISEIAYPTHRQVATTFYNTCWYLGAVIAAWVTYGTRLIDNEYCWRIPSYLQGALAVVQLALFWMIPESPRYLINRGKIEQAEAILMKHHVGNEQDPDSIALVKFEVQEIRAALEMEKISAHTRYTDFFRTPANRKRLFICIFVPTIMQLSGNGLVSYYLNLVLNSIGITGETEQLEINGGLMIYNMVTAMSVAVVVNRFRRRTLFLTSISFMLVSYVIWTILSAINQQRNFEDKSLGNGVLAMIFFFYLAYNIGANGLPYLYLTEILPYNQRAKGINIMQVTNNLVLIYNGFVNPIAMDAIEWKYYIVYCCILVVELILVFFFFPETSGYTLEEVCKVFGDEPPELVAIAEPKSKISFDHIENV